jgi:hypothetical protein
MKTKCFKCGSENVAKRIKPTAKAKLAECGLPAAETYCGRCINDAFQSAGKLNTGLAAEYRVTVGDTKKLAERCRSMIRNRDSAAYEKLIALKLEVAAMRKLCVSLLQDFDKARKRAQEMAEIVAQVQAYISESEDSVEVLISNSYEARRQAANRFTANDDVRREVFQRCGAICIDCGSRERLTLDHIIPVVEGGLDEISNIQVLCLSCNSSKGGRIETAGLFVS